MVGETVHQHHERPSFAVVVFGMGIFHDSHSSNAFHEPFTCTGMCLVFAGHPFDLLKVRLQTMTTVPGQAPPYASAMDCARQTVAKEGVSWCEVRMHARPRG